MASQRWRASMEYYVGLNVSLKQTSICVVNLGLVIGRAKFNVFAVRAEELIEGRPELIAADQTAARSAQCRRAAGQRA